MKPLLICFLALSPLHAETALDKNTSPSSGALARKTYVSGWVVQRTGEGLLIQTKARGDAGQVWLEGYDAKAGTKISVAATKVGAKDFTTAFGLERRVDLYRFDK